jgi:hypothetical protein
MSGFFPGAQDVADSVTWLLITAALDSITARAVLSVLVLELAMSGFSPGAGDVADSITAVIGEYPFEYKCARKLTKTFMGKGIEGTCQSSLQVGVHVAEAQINVPMNPHCRRTSSGMVIMLVGSTCIFL